MFCPENLCQNSFLEVLGAMRRAGKEDSLPFIVPSRSDIQRAPYPINSDQANAFPQMSKKRQDMANSWDGESRKHLKLPSWQFKYRWPDSKMCKYPRELKVGHWKGKIHISDPFAKIHNPFNVIQTYTMSWNNAVQSELNLLILKIYSTSQDFVIKKKNLSQGTTWHICSDFLQFTHLLVHKKH